MRTIIRLVADGRNKPNRRIETKATTRRKKLKRGKRFASGSVMRPHRKRRKKRLSVSPSEAIESNRLPSYDSGFDEGYNRGADFGYERGYYDGGQAFVERLLPEHAILPEISLESVVSAGLKQLSRHFHYLLDTAEVVRMFNDHLLDKRPFSLIRLGDGELLTMAQDLVMDIEQVRKEGPFLPYAGVNVPNLQARDLLAQAVRGANVVGIPQSRQRTFQPLAFQVFRACGIDYRNLALTHSTINYSIYLDSLLPELLRGHRLLLVGNLASEVARALVVCGYEVAGVITPVSGVEDVSRVMGEIAAHDFDLALVSAGIAAVIIVYRIASEMGRAAIDFGHMADAITNGKVSLESV